MSTEQSLPILDDPTRMQSVDKRNMLRIVDELPEQCETAMSIGRSFVGPDLAITPDVIYLTGSGDNALACETTGLMLADYCSVPVCIGHLGQVPKYVGESSLAILVDYYGKNPSAIKTCEELLARGCKVVCVTSGGKLSEAASSGGAKIFKIPPGQPSRSAFGYITVPVIAIAAACNLAPGAMEKLSSAILLLKNAREEFRFSRPSTKNTAKQVAEFLFGKKVYVMGAGTNLATAAHRWKSQINQNSKTPACAGNLIDDIEGSISGLERPVRSDDWGLVLLRSDPEPADAKLAVDTTLDVLKNYSVFEAKIKGRTTIETLLYGSYMADYVSCYLALLYGVNPSVTDYASQIQDLIKAASIAAEE